MTGSVAKFAIEGTGQVLQSTLSPLKVEVKLPEVVGDTVSFTANTVKSKFLRNT
jgi:hypothetical protein